MKGKFLPLKGGRAATHYTEQRTSERTDGLCAHNKNMPKYFCDYCDTYLTHDSPSVRRTHNTGRKHRDEVRRYYEMWLEAQTGIKAMGGGFPPDMPRVNQGRTLMPTPMRMQGAPPRFGGGAVPPYPPPSMPYGGPPGGMAPPRPGMIPPPQRFPPGPPPGFNMRPPPMRQPPPQQQPQQQPH